MSDPTPIAAESPLPHDGLLDHGPGPDEARALLRTCFARYRSRLLEAARASLDMAGDLFESASAVPAREVESFRSKQGEWLERFDHAIADSFGRWCEGHRRRGRRPDPEASAASLSIMTPFDQQQQAALVEATAFLQRFTQRETAALDARLAALAPGPSQEQDNAFAPDYVLDALGATSRAVFPDPRIWRPLMVRVLADLTPAVNKIYISLNRALADHGILPGMKASLRARSQWRPADDKDLLPTFSRMLAEAGPLPTDIEVPPASNGIAGTPPAPGLANPRSGTTVPAPMILAGLAALTPQEGRRSPNSSPAERAMPIGESPLVGPGSSNPLLATLDQWQRLDLPAALLQSAARGDASAALPDNLVPHIRAAVTSQVENPADRTAMDVVALLFSYVFRDPSIPESRRRLFGRLQIPIVKAALVDDTFFSDARHPARALLDHLAEGAIGAITDDAYGERFETAATRAIDSVCKDFEADVAVFARADSELVAFLDAERHDAAPHLSDQVAVALAAEEGDAVRAEVRALVRDRLAGLDLPFEVRTFAETVWADYLTALRKGDGPDGDASRAALATLDELLWSIEIKERAGQKARLMKIIPGLVGGLRRGCTSVAIPDDRARSFFDALYALHMTALKPASTALTRARARNATGKGVIPSNRASAHPAAVLAVAPFSSSTVHDFVSEMAVGTWLTIGAGEAGVNARLSWVSPLRSKYVFTSRSRAQAYVFSPEELAFELGSGRASLVVEPVPLFDRAVSAALDSLAARKPPAAPTLIAA